MGIVLKESFGKGRGWIQDFLVGRTTRKNFKKLKNNFDLQFQVFKLFPQSSFDNTYYVEIKFFKKRKYAKLTYYAIITITLNEVSTK